MSRPRVLAIPLLLALVFGLAACGGSKRRTDVTVPALGSTTAPTTAAATPTTPTASSPATTPTQATTTSSTTARTTPATTPTPRSSPEGTGGAQAGCPGAVGGFIRDVQARGTDCGAAGDVARAWFTAVHGGAAPDSQITAAGYACSGVLAGERASVTCDGAGGSTVTFTASP